MRQRLAQVQQQLNAAVDAAARRDANCIALMNKKQELEWFLGFGEGAGDDPNREKVPAPNGHALKEVVGDDKQAEESTTGAEA